MKGDRLNISSMFASLSQVIRLYQCLIMPVDLWIHKLSYPQTKNLLCSSNKPLEWTGHRNVHPAFKSPCLPLRGSVRRIGGKGESIGVNSRSMALSVRQVTQSFGQSIVHSDA
jgi:hypothetical protein